MSRIGRTFDALKQEGRAGLVGYLTAGDPHEAASEKDIRAAIENGLDVLELGIPFSDPTADGPTIQAASHRALASGMTLPRALGMVERLRRDYDLPIVLFGYANLFFRYGYADLCRDAAAAGADGLLVVDVILEESADLRAQTDSHGLDLIPLVAPTTPIERAARILEGCRGFVYYIMVTGVTGARSELPPDVADHVARLRECTDLPIAAGFGVSNAGQAAAVGGCADAVVVGSALIRAARNGNLAELVGELRKAL